MLRIISMLLSINTVSESTHGI